MKAELYILDTRIDLFDDENIEVISSVIDIADLTKNTQSFTRGFTVPASKANNIFFKFWFNANIENSFDSRVKHSSYINIDGEHFRFGFVKLTKVIVKSGKPSSYSVTFSGSLKDISKKLGSDKLAGLDLSYFNHSYDSNTVKEGLTNSVQLNLASDNISGNVVYTPIAKKQYFIQENGENTSTEKLQNISFNGGAATGIIWNDLKPSLKLIKIIEAIETDYSITFSRHFFDTDEFRLLSLWLNPSKDIEIKGASQIVDWTSNGAGSIWMDLATNIASYPCNQDTNQEFQAIMNVTPKAGFELVSYTVRMYIDNALDFEEAAVGNWSLTRNNPVWTFFSDSGAQVKSVYWEIVSEGAFEYDALLRQKDTLLNIGFTNDTLAANNNIESDLIIADEMPDIKVIDFLKGIFSIYKLIIIPEDDGSFYVNTLNAYYGEGGLHDITRYVDYESWDVAAGKLFNEIKFTFEEPTTILGLQYKQNNNRGFGDEELTIREDPSDITSPQIDGETFELKAPFEQLVFERLTNLTTAVDSATMHASVIDESLNPVNPKPVIHYTRNIPSYLPSLIGFQNDLGSKDVAALPSINNAFYADQLQNPRFSTTFSKEINIWDGIYLDNTLYSNHFKNYIEQTFNIKKREYKFNCKKLPSNILNKLKLNDVLKIKNDYFRINKFNSNITSGKVGFECVNYLSDDVIGQVRATNLNVNTDYEAKRIQLYLSNATGATSLKVEIAVQGTDWITVVQSEDASTQPGMLVLDILENISTSIRTMFIDVTNNGYTARVFVRQNT